MLPSTRLVWWSRTRLSIPESLSSDCRNDRRTGSLVRSSSFMCSASRGCRSACDGAALDRSLRSIYARWRSGASSRSGGYRRAHGTGRRFGGARGGCRSGAGGPQTVSRPAVSKLLGGDLERVNRLIVERMQSPVALIPQLAGHIVASGGKRLRPMLTLGCARLCGYRGSRHIALAAAVEFIHTATLLHDDVVDASDLRRGRDTANARLGQQAGDPRRRLSVQPLLRADGRRRIAAHSRDPVARLLGHRRGRGAAADDAKRPADDRSSPISR